MNIMKKLLSSGLWQILFIVILLTGIASARADITVKPGEDIVKITVKNTGSSPIYVLNVLTIVGSGGDIVYTSGDISSADILKISPKKSYTFSWNTYDATDDTYKGKIYIGNTKKSLTSTFTKSFKVPERSKNVHFYTNKKSYKKGQNVGITLRNDGLDIVYVPNLYDTKWEIINQKTKEVIHIPFEGCNVEGQTSYGGCQPYYYELRHHNTAKQTWNQKDDSGKQVKPGTYIAKAVYSFDNSDLDKITIYTSKFVIK